MPRAAVLMIAAFAAFPSSAWGQDSGPVLAGPYGATSLSEGLRVYHFRVGARVALPFRGRLEFYPGLEADGDRGFSQAFLEMRVRPLSDHGIASVWYLGGGLALASQTWRSSLLTGAQLPSGRLRPFIELHVFNFDGGNGSADLHMGLAVPIS